MKRLWLGLMALLLLWPATAVLADEPVVNLDGGKIFVDEDVSLEPGESFNGDLGVFDGDLTVPERSVVNGDVFVTNGDVYIGGRVNGDLAVINGALDLAESGQVAGDVFGTSSDLEVAGQVNGDLSVLFGDMKLESTAVVLGNLMVLDGEIERERGAQVLGEEMSDIPLPPLPFIQAKPSPPEEPEWAPPTAPPTAPPRPQRETLGQRIGRFVSRSLTAGLLSLLFITVGALIVVVWPRATRQVSDCIAALPIQSFGLGLLTFLIAAGLEALAMVLMILIILVGAALISTITLFPLGLLLIILSALVLLPAPVALVGAMALGWIGLADLVGQKVLRALQASEVKPLGTVLVGLVITVPLAALLWVLKPCCLAWPFIILLTSVGLGAVVYTHFGARSCRAAPASAALPLEAMDEEAGRPDSSFTG